MVGLTLEIKADAVETLDVDDHQDEADVVQIPQLMLLSKKVRFKFHYPLI